MTRILQITSYPTHPTARPRYGGQIRARQTVEVLERAGWTVSRAPIYHHSHYRNAGGEPAIDLDRSNWTAPHAAVSQVAELTQGAVLAHDKVCFAAFDEWLSASRADLVMLEQPWLWPAFKRWRDQQQGNAPRLIYNAHNLEAAMKRRILEDAAIPKAEAIAQEIVALERELVVAADGVTATTEGDAATFRQWTARPVVVAANGTAERRRSHLAGILPTPLQPWWRYVLFVGSAHPPNFRGFADLLVNSLATLRSDEQIVVAGGVTSLIVEGLAAVEGLAYMLRDRLVLLGEVTDFALDCLIRNASAMLLPITYGGGSNLKTAEALLAGRPVIATATAFRGFEAFADLPGVTLAKDADGFSQAIRRALDGEAVAVARDARLQALSWDRTLAPIVGLVRQLVLSSPRLSVSG